MSGLRKTKKYDWKDSNLALFGSDLEKNVKKESAEKEPAWKGAGQHVGVQIWRIVKFKVTHWPKEDYGKFYNGDSYIVLNTYQDPDSEELSYDVHFWIGKESTQDEYGTAAYKTVELDNFLDGKPDQHREVQGHESALFRSYFKTLSILKGGADTGFRSGVVLEDIKPRLIVCDISEKRYEQREKKMKRANMANDKVVIIDCGLYIYQWNGKEASRENKYKTRISVDILRSQRGGKPKLEVFDDETVQEFNPKLAEIIPDDSSKKTKKTREPVEKTLFRLSDASGRLEFAKVSSGDEVKKSQLNSMDVFILETDGRCYVWCGAKASSAEKRKCLEYAHKYMMTSNQPLVGISVVKEGSEPKEFDQAIKN